MRIRSWKNVPGYEGIYQVSDDGRVRSLDREDAIGLNGPGRELVQSPRRGYPSVGLWRDGHQTRFNVHRLVLLAHDRQPKPGEQCRHLDGNTDNNKIENLKWGTCSENQLDKHAHGTMPDFRGEGAPNAKINDQVVKVFRSLYPGQISLASKLHGVCIETVYNVRSGETWGHVP